VLTSLAANVISLVVIVGVAVGIGFRSGAGALAWLAVAGLLILFTLALTWIAVIPGLTAKSVAGAGAFSYPLVFLPFISSAFVPTGTMPGPVRAFAEHQPVTSIVNAIRVLSEIGEGDPVDDSRLEEAADIMAGLFEQAYAAGELNLGELADDELAIDLLDALAVESDPRMERMLDLLRERGWAGWTRLERLTEPPG
jgi:hypothetical protein